MKSHDHDKIGHSQQLRSPLGMQGLRSGMVAFHSLLRSIQLGGQLLVTSCCSCSCRCCCR